VIAPVAVVTDSTADLPRDLVESIGLRVVPLSVAFGDRTEISGVTLQPEDFYPRLANSSRMPTTSQPSPAWFEEAYADCADDGHQAIVSVHCSAALSGTVSLARDRAEAAELPVEVIDTKLVGGSLGLAALAAHRVAERGGSVAEVVSAVERVRERSLGLLVVDTLEYLKRGGRLTGTQAMVGTALKVKPLLHLTPDGTVEVRERTRTWGRAMDRCVGLVSELAAGGPVDVVVVHALAPERAAEMWRRLDDEVTIGERIEALIGPIVGTHVGPGAIGVAAVPSGEDR
jgi:DegV family protein with EDD domain